MKRIMIKHTIEIDEKDLEKWCKKRMIGIKEAVIIFRKYGIKACEDRINTILEDWR